MKAPRSGVERARELRRTMTPPELRLWQYLRTRPDGFTFRRQRPADPYTLDFYCREAALAIEVDGAAHDMGDNPAKDARRDLSLGRKGVKTMRILAKDLLTDPEAVVVAILSECRARSPR